MKQGLSRVCAKPAGLSPLDNFQPLLLDRTEPAIIYRLGTRGYLRRGNCALGLGFGAAQNRAGVLVYKSTIAGGYSIDRIEE